MFEEKTVSGLIATQLPEFVRADHPKFQKFIETYYEWLENPEGGNTVNLIMGSQNFRDIDYSLNPFLRLFKEEILPYFPEKSELDLAKILKGAREFYAQKGNENSLKWLFRVLFKQEIEIFYPKKQILKTSDGKWQLPKAFRLLLSQENANIDPALLKSLRVVGEESTAICVVENAFKTIDTNFGTELLEIYISNLSKDFINGEYLVIEGVEGYTEAAPFREKVVGALSSIRVDSDIRTDPGQRRRGLLYNVGDPVVITGGLDTSISAKDATAYVESVAGGSVENISIQFPGYGYRTYYNTESKIISSPGDPIGSNASSNVIVTDITLASVNKDSQNTFLEYVELDKMPIEYLATLPLNTADYTVLTVNNRNIILNVSSQGTPWIPGEYVYANGSNFATANFKGKILSANTGYTGAPANVIIYSVSNTVPLTTAGFLLGTNTLFTTNSVTKLNVTNIFNTALVANINSRIIQTLVFETIETGGLSFIDVVSGGFGFATVPRVAISSYYDTYLSEGYLPFSETNSAYKSSRQLIGGTGKIAHIYIDNGGTLYANGDTITVTGRGYGFTGFVNVDSTGKIVHTNITNRGEGYTGEKTATVTSGTGSGAVLSAYTFGEGAEYTISTGAIGRVQKIKLENRGFGYISDPIVSLKVADLVVNPISAGNQINVEEGNILYQGTLTSPSFFAVIKSYDPITNLLRLFNYSGVFNFASTLYTAKYIADSETSTQELTDLAFSPVLDITAKVPAPDLYPTSIKATGLPNPFFYGNGKAKAFAEFFNGLIKYDGFYVNTDGFPSSDKKLQDSKKYHNFSYIVQSESSLVDYKNAIYDIIHPAGTSLLAETVTNNEEKINTIDSNSYIVFANGAFNVLVSNVQISNSLANVVTGSGTSFTSSLVGNLINIIDTTSPLRSRSKVITKVDSGTSLNVEGWFVDIGQGKLSTNTISYSNVALSNVSGIYEPQTGKINYFSNARRIYAQQLVLEGSINTSTLTTTVTGANTTFTTDLTAGDLLYIDSNVKVVTAVANNNSLTINSAPFSNGTFQPIKLRANLRTLSVNNSIKVDDYEAKIVEITNERSVLTDTLFVTSNIGSSYYKINTAPEKSYISRNTGTGFASTLKINDVVVVNNETKRIVYIPNNDVAIVNTPFNYSSVDANTFVISYLDYIISENMNVLPDMLMVGDTIRLNVGSTGEYLRVGEYSLTAPYVNILSGNNIVSSRTPGIDFVDTQRGVRVGDTIKINNEIRRVASIINTKAITVNSSFDYTAVDQYCYKVATQIDANVVTVSDSIITTNISSLELIGANLSYYIIPNYTTKNYPYSFIITTE